MHCEFRFRRSVHAHAAVPIRPSPGIARMLSSENADLFVNVLGGKECPVLLDPRSRFYDKAQLWALFNDRKDPSRRKFFDDSKRARMLVEKLRTTAESRSLQDVQVMCKLTTPMMVEFKVPAHVIELEEMRSDLGQIALLEPIDWDHMYDQVNAALQVMHEKKIVHNDLHIHNVLVDGKAGKGHHKFKIHDFGRARRYTEPDELTSLKDRDRSLLGLSLQAFAERFEQKLATIQHEDPHEHEPSLAARAHAVRVRVRVPRPCPPRPCANPVLVCPPIAHRTARPRALTGFADAASLATAERIRQSDVAADRGPHSRAPTAGVARYQGRLRATEV